MLNFSLLLLLFFLIYNSSKYRLLILQSKNNNNIIRIDNKLNKKSQFKLMLQKINIHKRALSHHTPQTN